MVFQANRTVILGHGGKQGSSKTLVVGSTVDAVTAAKAPGFITSKDSAPLPPALPVSTKEIQSASAVAPVGEGKPVETPLAPVQSKPEQPKPGKAKSKPKPGAPRPLPESRNEVKIMSDADSRQLSSDLGIEFAADETADAIQDRIVKELNLS